MITQKYLSTHSNKAQEITFLRVVIGALLLIAAVEGAVLFKTLGMEKTIVVPPDIHKSFWVSGEAVSKEYLEQMAYWYAGLVLNVTPSTGEYQKRMFLNYAAPQDTGRLASEVAERLTFLEKNNAATQFSGQTLNSDEKLMKVAITGDLYTFVGDKRISTKHAVFVVGFKYLNGRLYVSEFKETNEQDIFGVRTTGN
ncbi:MAG: type IV conjugative transfer system protein TraE [Gallionella sp.]|nr:type IV conjugative transfer system protein TraE [Gallionella sp.]